LAAFKDIGVPHTNEGIFILFFKRNGDNQNCSYADLPSRELLEAVQVLHGRLMQ
jgi:hypothetical protein